MIKTMITAHSGCEGTGIDTMDSIEKALEIGSDAVEIDVRIDPLGNLRVSHDLLSLEEYLEKNQLEKVFQRVFSTSLKVNFDIKEPKAIQKTIQAAKDFGFPSERLILTGCADPDILLDDTDLRGEASFFLNLERFLKYIYVHRRAEFGEELYAALMEDPLVLVIDANDPLPNAYLYDTSRIQQKFYAAVKTLKEDIFEDILRVFQETQAKAINLPKILLKTKFIKKLSDAGIPLSVWTVDEPDLMQLCLKMGVYNITTRCPVSALRYRNEYLNI